MNNKLFPMACGMLVGVLFVVLFCLFTRKTNKDRLKYDERQERARGIAFKYGFFSFFLISTVLTILAASQIALPISYALLQFMGIIISVAVFATISIVNDAYFSMNEDKKRVNIGFAVIAIVNGVVAICNLSKTEKSDIDSLASGLMNLLCTILFAYLFIVMLVHQLLHEKEDEEADDEEP